MWPTVLCATGCIPLVSSGRHRACTTMTHTHICKTFFRPVSRNTKTFPRKLTIFRRNLPRISTSCNHHTTLLLLLLLRVCVPQAKDRTHPSSSSTQTVSTAQCRPGGKKKEGIESRDTSLCFPCVGLSSLLMLFLRRTSYIHATRYQILTNRNCVCLFISQLCVFIYLSIYSFRTDPSFLPRFLLL